VCLALLCSCGPSGDASKGSSSNPNPPVSGSQGNNPSTPTPSGNPDGSYTGPVTQPSAPSSSDDTPAPSGNTGPTGLDFKSNVTDLEGTWKLSKVFADGNTTDAAADAMSLKISMELDPSELVDDAAYIHNQVYNLTGYLTFGMQEIVDELAVDDVEEYKGSTGWQDFPQGKVVKEGEFYEQPGPATMRFKDIDDYGLYLDKIAGVSADIETTNKNLILGMNDSGQLLLGYSEEHLERPGTEGEWVYCLIFDKAA